MNQSLFVTKASHAKYPNNHTMHITVTHTTKANSGNAMRKRLSLASRIRRVSKRHHTNHSAYFPRGINKNRGRIIKIFKNTTNKKIQYSVRPVRPAGCNTSRKNRHFRAKNQSFCSFGFSHIFSI